MRLGHIGLTVFDLDRSARFYSELFGFKEFFRVTRDQLWIEAQTGYPDCIIEFLHMRHECGLHLELLKYHRPLYDMYIPDDTFKPGSSHFNLWVDDVESMTRKIREYLTRPGCDVGMAKFAGYAHDLGSTAITEGPQRGGRGYYMRDPDGHTIEVWEQAKTPEAQGFGHEINTQLAQIINRIEKARSENNTNWCDLIRLVYAVAPDRARAIFRRIEEKDAEILKLAQSSADA